MQVTPESAAWLTQTLDPYHDYPKEPIGKPDSVNGRSVIYCVNEQVSLTAPVVSDLHVFVLPELCQLNMGVIRSDNQISQPYSSVMGPPNIYIPTIQSPKGVGTETQTFGLFNWSMVPTGTPTINCPDLVAGVLPATPALGGIQGNTNYSKYCTGRSRVVSAAYEIHNTSAALYKGGASTSYRMSQGTNQTPFWTFLDIDVMEQTAYGDVDVIHCPPRTLAEVTAIPDSVVLGSEEGNYTVVPVHLHDPALACEYRPLIIRTSDQPNTPQSAFISTIGPDSPYIWATDTRMGTTVCRRPAAIDTVGSYHSGLAAGSTLTINTRVYIEVFPSTGDTIFPLSARSPGYCPSAEEALIRAFQHLPVTVPVKWNEAQKWWRIVLSTLGKLAPLVGAVGGPTGQALGLVIGGALTGFSDVPVNRKVARISKVPNFKPNNSPAADKADEIVRVIAPSVGDPWIGSKDNSPGTYNNQGVKIVDEWGHKLGDKNFNRRPKTKFAFKRK